MSEGSILSNARRRAARTRTPGAGDAACTATKIEDARMSKRRARILDAVNHRVPDRVPVDFGSMTATGLHCAVVADLRRHYGLEDRLPRIFDPYQMLAYIDEDLREAMDVDAVCVMPASTYFGNPLGEWKEWRALWGQDVLIPKDMEVDTLPDGAAVVYPQGDRTAKPSAKMPASGFYFDAIERQGAFDEENPDPRENVEDFPVLSEAALARIARNAAEAVKTGCAAVAPLPGTAFGSVSAVAGMSLRNPKGLRSLAEWYMALVAMPDFVKEVFELQAETALKNLELLKRAAGDAFDIVVVSATDFGTQTSPLISRKLLDELFSPYHKRVNDWIHANTRWKTFKHSCGAVEPLIESFIASGFDILNPVQCSAGGMDPELLKRRYGGRIVFWGGGVDSQTTLPFGTPAEVKKQALERCRIFAPGGGFVFNCVHNIQFGTPVANVLAMLEAVREYNTAGK